MSAAGRDALIVAHGQPSNPGPPERWLTEFAARVNAVIPNWTLRAATLATPLALETQLAELKPNSPIFPMFMSDGWFVSNVLPKRMKGADFPVLAPLGYQPDLVKVAVQIIDAQVQANRWAPQDSHILLAAHGSARGARAAIAAQAFARRLSERRPLLSISTGFIEQTPFIAQAARPLPHQTICMPFFALEGDHCRQDIPQSLEEACFSGVSLPPIGTFAAIETLVASAISASANPADLAATEIDRL